MRIPIPDAMYRRAVLIGGGNGIKQYAELNAYVRGKSPHTITGWERDVDGNLFAIVEQGAVLKTRAAERDRPRPA